MIISNFTQSFLDIVTSQTSICLEHQTDKFLTGKKWLARGHGCHGGLWYADHCVGTRVLGFLLGDSGIQGL